MMCALNIWRVNVLSTESGVDHPQERIFRNSALDCRYGNPAMREAERCIVTASPAKCFEAARYAPAHDAIFVLVNDTQTGGCANSVTQIVCSSISPGFAQTVTHELGHNIGLLADEYMCFVCDGSDNGRIYAPLDPSEQFKANLTINPNRAGNKWSNLIEASTPIPTMVDNPPSVVGLWPGGGYAASGIFRSQSSCHMSNSNLPFCAVCNNEMTRLLRRRCNACELDPGDPGSKYCFRFVQDVLYPWWGEMRFKFPMPAWLDYPPEDLIKQWEIIFDEVVFPGTWVFVYDEEGMMVAESTVREQGEPLRISFEGNRLKNFSVEIVTTAPQAETFNPTPRYVIN